MIVQLRMINVELNLVSGNVDLVHAVIDAAQHVQHGV